MPVEQGPWADSQWMMSGTPLLVIISNKAPTIIRCWLSAHITSALSCCISGLRVLFQFADSCCVLPVICCTASVYLAWVHRNSNNAQSQDSW